MLTTAEIKAKYKVIHDEWTAEFYPLKRLDAFGEEEVKTYMTYHDQIWLDMEAELKTASDYVEPEPVIDPLAKIAKLEDRIKALEEKK